MFTGIISSLAKVDSIAKLGDGIRMRFELLNGADSATSSPMISGESVGINGVCSSILPHSKTQFDVDYLPETLKKTNLAQLQVADLVNLEWALRLSDRMGGHLLSGHVDDTGQVLRIIDQTPFEIWEFGFDPKWGRYLVPKGCIAIDGISLTVVDVSKDRFSCHIIPHTQRNTILQQKKPGATVNLEFDLMAKYCQKYLEEKEST